MDHLVSLPYCFRVKDFIMEFRNKRDRGSEAASFVKPLEYDADGRPFITAEGQRKTCRAKVTLYGNGTGQITINGKSISEWQRPSKYRNIMLQAREMIWFPFIFLDKVGQFDVVAETKFGGESGVAGAVRLGISRALISFVTDEEREKMRLAGLLSYDPRRKERKKPGQKGANAKWIWKKR